MESGYLCTLISWLLKLQTRQYFWAGGIYRMSRKRTMERDAVINGGHGINNKKGVKHSNKGRVFCYRKKNRLECDTEMKNAFKI